MLHIRRYSTEKRGERKENTSIESTDVYNATRQLGMTWEWLRSINLVLNIECRYIIDSKKSEFQVRFATKSLSVIKPDTPALHQLLFIESPVAQWLERPATDYEVWWVKIPS